MKTVILLRHAKAEAPDFSMEDHARVLSKRGREAATLIGLYLAAHQLVPETILCSAAARTVETCDRLIEHLPHDIPIAKDEELYLANTETILQKIWKVSDDCSSVLLIGHNPGFHDLAYRLAADKRDGRVTKLREKFPTAALAALCFDVESWGEVDFDGGKLIDLVFPRELVGSATD